MTSVAVDTDGWQRPIGLIPSEAIFIDDSDSENEGVGSIDGNPNDDYNKGNQSTNGASLLSSVVSENGEPSDGKSNDANRVVSLNEGRITKPVQQQCDDNILPTKKDVPNGFEESNPFARFAFQPNESKQSTNSTFNESTKDQGTNHQPLKNSKLQNQPVDSSTEKSTNHPMKKLKLCWSSKKAEANTQGLDTEPEQMAECISKWHAFSIPTDPIEIRRFQVLIAARLHARCQESTVRKAMDRLRNHFESSHEISQSSQTQAEGLTPNTLSNAKSEDIAPLLSSVLFGNTKAQQIIQAAQDIVRMGGEVPETSTKLQKITGIGPKLASILTRVNTRASYCSEDK